MKRIGFLLKVRPDKVAEYKKHHEAVWPEMQAALRRSGWHNYTLFIREDGLVFGYFDAPVDFQAALAAIQAEPINPKWNEFMAPYFEKLPDLAVDESMLELEEYFHLE
jgi:L-rhamnose mutarotase